MKKLLIICFVISTSCKFTQIYEAKPSTKEITTEQYFTFENDTVKIKYSFWGATGGVIAFSFTNKLNVPLYIDWKKCSFIKNGAKFDYWKDVTITKGTTSLYFGDYDLINYQQFKSEKTTKPERITFLAPKSTIIRVWNNISSVQIASIPKGKTTELSVKGTKRKQKVSYQDYTESNTPLKFRNFMTISLSEKIENETYIDNEFYISRIYQMKNGNFDASLFEKPIWFYIQ